LNNSEGEQVPMIAIRPDLSRKGLEARLAGILAFERVNARRNGKVAAMLGLLVDLCRKGGKPSRQADWF